MVTIDFLVSVIPLLPLLGFLSIALLNKSLPHLLASGIACGVILFSFIGSVALFISLQGPIHSHHIKLFDWIATAGFTSSISFLVDPLSSVMMLIITGVGFLIHVYSIGYMHNDPGYNRYFSYLNLFVFFMLLLVMGSNYLLMFVGWEGVGLCSYLLIGFWFKNQAYNNAANKAFIMNRIGDLGMLMGILLVFVHFGSIEYADVFSNALSLNSGATLTIITLLLFIGAMGKSAQLPLYTWLPDAMAGPTPVSALIHAATMVTAGIYMIARNNLLYSLSPATLSLITIVGLATAIFAATIAIAQTDIKKVLAYSTVSQLGLMFLALGLGAYTTGIFHMATHAFFKALLFLGAGSIIHALSGEQDLRNMGGLRKYLPITFFTFLIGVLAISGIPPFAGFFSKDEILAQAFVHNKIIWALAVIASLLTAFYMFRLFFLVFYGDQRASKSVMSHIHESPKSITIPLVTLAVLSAVGGFIGIPEALGGAHWLQEFLSPVFQQSAAIIETHHLTHSAEYMLMVVVVLLTIVVILFAYIKYVRRKGIPAGETEKLGPVHSLVYHKYFVDEIYNAIVVKPLYWFSSIIDKIVERAAIDKTVNGFGATVVFASKYFRFLQSGSIYYYIFMMVISIVLLLVVGLITYG